jgi:RNA-directed DNA polymerase
LLHHIDVDLLEQAYHWLKRDAAAGVDGMTWAEYGEGLSDRLADLHEREQENATPSGPVNAQYVLHGAIYSSRVCARPFSVDH